MKNISEGTVLTDKTVSLQLFPGYTDTDTAIFSEFRNPEARAEPGFLVDFLGSRTRVTSVWKEVRELEGQVLDIPVPADFHAEAIEWIGVLKAVRSAKDQYISLELGAGFGPWTIAGALAAKHRGIRYTRLYAVEGDPNHFQFLRQHFRDNGLDPDQHFLFESAVGVNAGVGEWPVDNDSSPADQWGSRLLENSRDYRGLQFRKTRPVQIIPMRELVLKETQWDLIHIDVQGAEVDICRSCIEELNARTRWLVVATHSRKLDGDFLELMCSAGWLLEHEKPARFAFTPNPTSLEAMTTVDGTQVWRNPRFIRAGVPLTSFSQEITCTAAETHIGTRDVFTLDITVKNTGTQFWYGQAASAPVNLSYRWLDSQGNVMPIEGERTALNREPLRPGETDCIKMKVVAPSQPGLYTLSVSMVQESVAWFCDRGAKPLALHIVVG